MCLKTYDVKLRTGLIRVISRSSREVPWLLQFILGFRYRRRGLSWPNECLSVHHKVGYSINITGIQVVAWIPRVETAKHFSVEVPSASCYSLQMFSSGPFLKYPSSMFSLNLVLKVSRPYKTGAKIVVLRNLKFCIVDMRREYKRSFWN